MNKSSMWFSRLAFFATILTMLVISLGAYTRLKDAGLGCPDWPGCYGQVVVPQSKSDITKAKKAYNAKKVEPGKAWLEMIHRYFAGTLAFCVFVLVVWSLFRRIKDKSAPLIIPLLLVGVIIFQAMLGMWTVTWKLLPTVVMSHLLGGLTLASLLWSLTLVSDVRFAPRQNFDGLVKVLSVIALFVLGFQIFLGGWVSSNYSALVCTDFPWCHGSLWPTMDFKEGFDFLRPIGANYEGGLLSDAARTAIQMTHRYWAVVTAVFLITLASYLLGSVQTKRLRSLGGLILFLLFTQFAFGILNVKTLLSMPIALAHNGVAVLMLLTIVTLIYKVFAKPHPE